MSLYKQPGSDVWWVNITHNGERIRESTGERIKAAAQRIHDERKAELHKQPRLKGRKWSDAVAKWLETKSPSADEIASLLRFSKQYHDRLLTSVTPESIEDVLAINCDSAATYNRRRARIQGVLACVKVKLDIPKRAEGIQPEPRWLRPEEWVDLYVELPAHMKEWALFSITTGLRQSNVLQLRWDQVDLKRKYCWIERNTAKGKRSFQVPLSKEALDVLKTVQGDHPEFCFTYRGQPVTETKTAFIKACVRAGLGSMDTSGHYRGFTWHGFRHTWATWHVQNGTPLTVLQQLGAWSSYAMVLIYAHHAPSFLARYADNSTTKEE
jgi:integrase